METITRKPYETDLTDDEWAILEPILKRALYGDKTKTRGHPRHYPLREITNAILYVLKTGCQWRNLPHDLPPWKTVYYHFRRWERGDRTPSLWSAEASALAWAEASPPHSIIPIAEPEFTNSCACRIPPLPALSPLVKGVRGDSSPVHPRTLAVQLV